MHKPRLYLLLRLEVRTAIPQCLWAEQLWSIRNLDSMNMLRDIPDESTRLEGHPIVHRSRIHLKHFTVLLFTVFLSFKDMYVITISREGLHV